MSTKYSMLCRFSARIKYPPSSTRALWTARLPLTSSRRVPLRRGVGTLALAGVLGASAYLYLHDHPISLDSTPSGTDLYGSLVQPRTSGGQENPNQEPLTSLIRTYIVYTMCSIPWVVDNAPKALDVLMSIPVLKQVTEVVVRATFFAQFVGGDTAQETLPALERLRAENKGAMLHFGAEVDKNGANVSHPRPGETKSKKVVNMDIIDEFIRCIDIAGDFEDGQLEKPGRTTKDIGMEGRKTSVAVKLTALIPNPNTFINFSRYLTNTRSRPSSSIQIPFPGIPRSTDLDILSVDPFDLPPTCPLSKEDLDSLIALKEELFRMCRRAQERGVVVYIDAEHSGYQPAIEAFQIALMREFNSLDPLSRKGRERSQRAFVQPLVYGTFQMYLRRARGHLEQSIRDAEEGQYALGVKLVRGAYHDLETSSHLSRNDKDSVPTRHGSSISPDSLPPVWQTKSETDECFNDCARMLVKRVAADIAEETKKRSKGKEGYAPKLGLTFGTHNPASCELVLNTLVDEGLAVRIQDRIEIRREAARRLAIGQLYGMCDTLTSSIASRTFVRSSASESDNIGQPIAFKCVPYGPPVRVMPYLGRRARENRSVLSGAGGAKEERERAWKEIVKRLKGWFGFN